MAAKKSLSNLKKTRANRVMGIDCSTHSFAFAIIDNGTMVKYGEVFFNGSTVFERLNDARHKIDALMKAGHFKADFVCIEAAVMVRSIGVAIKLAYVYGAVMSVLLENKATVVEATPVAWQSFIGNKNFTKSEKDALKKDFPGKSATWYSNKTREIRKQRTLVWASDLYGVKTESDNVGDACGLAHYAYYNLTNR